MTRYINIMKILHPWLTSQEQLEPCLKPIQSTLSTSRRLPTLCLQVRMNCGSWKPIPMASKGGALLNHSWVASTCLRTLALCELWRTNGDSTMMFNLYPTLHHRTAYILFSHILNIRLFSSDNLCRQFRTIRRFFRPVGAVLLTGILKVLRHPCFGHQHETHTQHHLRDYFCDNGQPPRRLPLRLLHLILDLLILE